MKKGQKIFSTISGILIMALLIISTLFLVYDLYLFTGILKFYRIMGAILIIYIAFLLSQELIVALKKQKLTKYIVFLIIILIYSCALSFTGYYVYRIISNLDNFSKEETNYSVSLISFNKDLKTIESLDKLKIGIIEDTTDISNYVLAQELIKEYNLEDYNQIVKYSSTQDLITALYNEEVDAIFINSDFKALYGKLEEYKDLGEKANIIKTYKKNVKDISTTITEDSSKKTLTDPFTILLLGVDSEDDGLNPNSAFNGDTMMMVTFNPNTLEATMFSIPRDTYVPISCNGNRINKVNSAAYGGASCVVKTLENLTGITIDYYAMINFKGVVDLVDALGKITVNVPMDFCEQNSSRAYGENEICLKTGVQVLSGEQALALARHRKTLLLGDFQRGQNQQLVVEGMLSQLKTIRSVNQVIEILDIVNKNLSTNLTKEQILSLYEVGKKMIIGDNTNLFNIQKTFLTGYDMNVYEPASQGSRYAFFHYKQSLNDIVTAMKQNLGILEITPIKTFSFSINEIYEREIIGYTYYSESKYPTVPDFTYYSIYEVISWANSYGLPINIIDNSTKTALTSDYDNYSIVWQNERPTTLVFRLDSLTIYVVNKYSNTNNETGNDSNKDNNSSTSSTDENSSSASSTENDNSSSTEE